jgi:signal transduction histidine kinase/CheY-like chemotaxis protein
MTVSSSFEFLSFTSSLLKENTEVTAKNLKNHLIERERSSKAAATAMSFYPPAVKAVAERDTAQINEVFSSMLELFDITYFTVTDENGTVLLRTYDPESSGDSILNQQNVRDALDGKISTYYESGTLVKISIRTGAPVYNEDGKLIGAVSAGVRLDQLDALYRLKELFNAELTVFFGDMRLVTTLVRDGKRVEGPLLDDGIARIVMEEKKEHFSSTYNILGETYKDESYSTFWLPLLDSHDEVFAMLAAAVSNDKLFKAAKVMITSNIIIGLLGLGFSIAVLLYIVTRITKPVNKLVRLVSDVTRGNINVDVDAALVTEDEIGSLAHDFYSLLDVVKSMLSDLSEYTHELSVSGDIEFQIDMNKYSGSYKDIIDGIAALGKSISMKNKTMAVMDCLDVMISVVDFDYNVLYLNKKTIDVYGIDKDKCFGGKCYKVIRKLDEPCPICRMPELADNKDSFPSTGYKYEYDECIGKWLGVNSSVIRWIDGSKVFSNSFKDETQAKNYEAQLYESAQKAQAASVAKSAFLANMSHEIRTPMNSIMGFAELAMDGELPRKTKDYIGKIHTNAQWLLQIINDILDISKIESGKMELEKIPFDLHEVFGRCRTVIAPVAMEKGINLHFYAEPSVGRRLLGDPTRMGQVLANLLSNAVKFTHTGIIKLFSEIRERTKNTAAVYFEVIDSGIGMTAQEIEKIFDPFTQAETGTTRKYGGTGLGLTITRNIVEMMGGKLSVESTPGVGSKFSFTIVFDTIDIADDDIHEKKIVFDDLKKPFFKGEVLLCEDNAMNQQVICEHLARVGLKTVVAENGRIGVNMVKERMEKGEKQFDLIFMDMHMPEMDGLEASAKIIELGVKIPLVAMTANVMEEDREIYKKSGMHDFVGKPFTSQELWNCLMKYFEPADRISAQEKIQQEIDDLPEDELEYQKTIIKLFVKSNLKKSQEIKSALEAGDIKLAHRLAHTLKGNAAQIGKNALHHAAQTVEKLLKDGQNTATKEQLETLENELNLVLDELLPLFDEEQLT